MKIISTLLAVLLLLTFTTSCGNKKAKTKQEQIAEFRSMLTPSDTTQMLQICDNAMELLKKKNIDEVLAAIHEYDDSLKEVKPLSEMMRKRLTNQFKMFPVLNYRRVYYSFMLEGCNDVKYDIEFATAEQAGTETAPVTSFMFNPVKVGNDWKLCVKTADMDIDFSKD